MNNKRIDGKIGFPEKNGLYDPANEKDSCGVGFVANIKGIPSHGIMTDAYHINSRMDHRGGCGFEENTGDGAGILMAISHKFFEKVLSKQGITLPEPQAYAIGNVFLPNNPDERAQCKEVMERIIQEEGLQCLGFREVPICPDEANIGPAARDAMPFIEQVIIEGSKTKDHALEHALYLIRRRFIVATKQNPDLKEGKQVYICSLNSRIIVYKGMLTPGQLFPFYPDLEDEDYESHLAMVHSQVLYQHFPKLGSRTAKPLHEPQRRNQHASWQ